MESTPTFKLPAIKARLRRTKGCVQVWDSLRGMWLVLTPEEWVRRHAIEWLMCGLGYDAGHVSQEVPVDMHGADQRADIVTYNAEGQPVIVCECKAADIKIADNSVLSQAVRYNYILGAPALMLTNGCETLFYECRQGRYAPLTADEFVALYSVSKR